MTNQTRQTEERKCPLCGGDNNCAMANGSSAENCWCLGVQLKHSALAAIPEQDQGVRCICAACGISPEEAQR